MPVTYRDLPRDIDPVDFLFGDEKLTVPQNSLTPKQIIRFYQRALQDVEVKSLYGKNDHVPYGLESLPSLLRYEPGYSGIRWFSRKATKEMIEPALPELTPYQLQYLVLFGFGLPKWENIPLVPSDHKHFGGSIKVMGEIESTALLYGKNEQLYFVTARWKPEEGYFGGGEEPRFLEHGPFIFHLSRLAVEMVSWLDPRIIERVESGQWADAFAFTGNLRMVLQYSAEVLEGRARSIRKIADRFDFDSIPIRYSRR